MDPELHISIVDLGLVYDVKIKSDNKVEITMTLTTMGCPLFDVIEEEVKDKLKNLKLDEKNISINLTFEPPWSMDSMTERGKALLGI